MLFSTALYRVPGLSTGGGFLTGSVRPTGQDGLRVRSALGFIFVHQILHQLDGGAAPLQFLLAERGVVRVDGLERAPHPQSAPRQRPVQRDRRLGRGEVEPLWVEDAGVNVGWGAPSAVHYWLLQQEVNTNSATTPLLGLKESRRQNAKEKQN